MSDQQFLVPEDRVENFVHEVLLNPERTRPVIGVTTRWAKGPWVSPSQLQREFGERAFIYLFETGDPTWQLTDVLPAGLDVYGGALRVWWPGLCDESDPREHPLLMVHNPSVASRLTQKLHAMLSPSETEATTPTTETIAPPTSSIARTTTPSDLYSPRFRQEPNAWKSLEGVVGEGDCVKATVLHAHHDYVLVALRPGVRAKVDKREVDWEYVEDSRDYYGQGDLVDVKILELDTAAQLCHASIKRGFGQELVSVPGAGVIKETAQATARRLERQERDLQSLREQLREAIEDKKRLASNAKSLRSQLSQAQRSNQTKAEANPFESETAFLTAVRVVYAERFNETDRQARPLRPMTVGRCFLESARELEGVDPSRVVRIAAQVASDPSGNSLSAHHLGTGHASTDQRVRTSDGAKAWRCYLQGNTPGSRRLHYWTVHSQTYEQEAVEFASVNLHDDYGIPE